MFIQEELLEFYSMNLSLLNDVIEKTISIKYLHCFDLFSFLVFNYICVNPQYIIVTF